MDVGLKKLDQLAEEKDQNDSRTLIDMLRENLETWENIDPKAEEDSEDER